jgi:hypothetical protein
MSRVQRRTTQFTKERDLVSRIQELEFQLQLALALPKGAASTFTNETLFIDTADNKLKFKDSSGTTNLLY